MDDFSFKDGNATTQESNLVSNVTIPKIMLQKRSWYNEGILNYKQWVNAWIRHEVVHLPKVFNFHHIQLPNA